VHETVTVTPSLREVAVRLKEADAALWKITRRNLVVAVAPARPAIRASARESLPQRGGLNEWVAKSSITTTVLTGSRTAGVRLRVRKSGHDLADLDQGGVVRHPVFGNRDAWVSQQVPPGFATRVVERMRPEITAACLAAMREAAAVAGFK
jgi:hypothetical protein